MSVLVKIQNKSNNPLPKYETSGSAGMDVRCNEDIRVAPQGRILVGTGLFAEIPEGYEIQVRPRSGIAYKHGVTVINSPGTIDCDYRGEISIILINHGNEVYVVPRGERIAQLVLAKVDQAVWVQNNDKLSETDRGSGGFGSTGK